MENKNEYLKRGIEKGSRKSGGEAQSGGERKERPGFGIG